MTLNFSNTSSAFVLLDGIEPSTSQLLLPDWFLWTFIGVIVLGGCLTNGLLAGYLARRGIYPAVLHLCLTDIASLLFLAPYELFVLTDPTGVWKFPRECCPIFLGLEVLLGTATIYLIIVITFSSAAGDHKRSIKVPLLTVWLLSVSLSVPDFIFGDIISPRPSYPICCLPKRAAFIISTFRLSLPVLLLFVGLFVDVFVSCKFKQPGTLCLPLVLALTFIVFSVQRSLFGVLYGVIFPLSGPDAFRTPPIANVVQSPLGTLLMAMAHYTLSSVRPLISWCSSTEMRTFVEQPSENQVV